MKVWIEQEFCTGDALCGELCPDVFEIHDDSLAYVKSDDGVKAGFATMIVPDELESAVLDAQAQCAGECIYVER
ncbi:MAG: ferredoxin [Acidimicrobiales bacterium]|jgi:ferredoxin